MASAVYFFHDNKYYMVTIILNLKSITHLLGTRMTKGTFSLFLNLGSCIKKLKPLLYPIICACTSWLQKKIQLICKGH